MDSKSASQLMCLIDEEGEESYFQVIQRILWKDGKMYLIMVGPEELGNYMIGYSENLLVEVVCEVEEKGETRYTTADDDIADEIVMYLQACGALGSEPKGNIQ